MPKTQIVVVDCVHALKSTTIGVVCQNLNLRLYELLRESTISNHHHNSIVDRHPAETCKLMQL